MFAIGAITISQAQSSRSYSNDRNANRDVILVEYNNRIDRNDRYDRRYENNTRYAYASSSRERDKAINRIDRD